MSKNLVIVESPAKAKTIEGFLGKDFTVKSSFGHVRDLVKKGYGVDIEHNFKPTYEISEDKLQVISELKKLSKKAEMVWLASDEDREGEAISWHLFETLELEKSKTRRIVFHEITKPAILNAIAKPREIDEHLVNAQQARRILDRLVGFELSPILWKKIKPSLSAGRVQSVAVRLIVEREREIIKFTSTAAFKVAAEFITTSNEVLKAELNKRFSTADEAYDFVNACIKASFTVNAVEQKPAKRTPSAPFTTSTLQQEASRKLGFSVGQTMTLAQRLYESGKITYMRTDSVNLSETALTQARECITELYGAPYYFKRQYKTKNKSAQEAHEAIRPTQLKNASVSGERNEQRLYDLIWKRTIASQMSDAALEKTQIAIDVTNRKEQFTAQGEVIIFDGFLKVYNESRDEDPNENSESEGLLPALKINDVLQYRQIHATERFSHHPARYTEASLVKKMEELGIGRPSTYAPTISTIQKRNYVEKGDREGKTRTYTQLLLENSKITELKKTELTGAEKSKLFPTDMGLVVTDFLMQYFPTILDVHFTARVEEEFDEIAEGKLSWTKMLQAFYKPFHKTVEHTSETGERASGERILGKDPKSGKTILVRIGRFGPLAQLGDSSSENNSADTVQFASLRKDQRIETITLEEALNLFKLPHHLGTYKEAEIIINAGRFGPYIKYNEAFISIPKNEDPLQITSARAIELIEEKLQADAPVALYQSKPVTKGKGRFGPYLKYDGIFINIPRAYNPDQLSESDIKTLIDQKLEKESKRFIQQWPEASISIENGRWGPFIRYKKQMLKLGKPTTGNAWTEDLLKSLALESVKAIIEQQIPGAFNAAVKKSKKTEHPKKSTKKPTSKTSRVKKGK
jgi:DNA topoisomerase-1